MPKATPIDPESVKSPKPKFIISGKSGVGKTWLMLDFPQALIIDCEGSAARPEYKEKMKAVGAKYIGKEQGANDFQTVIDTLADLAKNQHNYKTVIIDSFSHLFDTAASIAEEKVGNEYGRDKKEANRPARQLKRWIDKLDCTVALVCHSKAKWEKVGDKREETGTTFSGPDNFEYLVDLWIEAQQVGKSRTFMVKKSRIKNFVVGNSYPLDYDTFANLYGKDTIEQAAQAMDPATDAQIQEIKGLVELFNLSKEQVEKSLKNYDAEAYEELSKDQAAKIIQSLNEKKNKGAK